jgi:Holliday junction resolvase
MKMAMTPEKKVKNAVAKHLKEIGAYYFFPATGGYGRSGVPDIVGCYEGKFFGIECKAGNNTTTALQKLELEKIEKSAGIAMVVNEDNVATFKEVLQKSKGRTETPGLLDELEG